MSGEQAPKKSDLEQYLSEKADVVIPIGHEGALSMPEVMDSREFFDERQRQLRTQTEDSIDPSNPIT